MTLAVWPYNVNQRAVKETYRETQDENVARFQPDVGGPKLRRRMSISTKQIQFDTVLTTTEVSALETFWRTTLKDGTLPFSRVNPRSGLTEVYFFNSPYQRQDWSFTQDRVSFSMRQAAGYSTGVQAWGGIDSYVKLLLHADGANAATTTTDSSSIGRAITFNGGAILSTNQVKFGTTSVVCTVAGTDTLQTVSTADIKPTGDYTIDFWAYLNSLGVAANPFVYKAETFGSYIIQYSGSGNVIFYSSSNNSSFDIANAKQMGAISAGAWTHIAICRSGNTYYPFVGGVLGTTWTSSATPYSGSAVLLMNAVGGCYMDELRFSNGIARWTANFTPAADAYTT